MIVIGIHGLRGSGKDTLAKAIKKQIYGTNIMAFADRLKETAARLFDVPLWVFYDEQEKERYQTPYGTPREIMVNMSKGLKPIFGDNIFLDPIGRAIEANRFLISCIVVSDVRGEHEASFIRNHGGTVVHLSRPNMPEKPIINHWSEGGIEVHTSDITISVQEGMEHVEAAAKMIVDRLNKP